mgnify:CR=1 FL=1
MLPKKNRLNKKEVESVFRKGKKITGNFLILKLKKEEKKTFSSFSVIVPVRISKKSTERNKIKRKIREVLRKKLPKIKIGFSGIFIALPNVVDKNFKEIEDEINKLITISKIKKI